MAPMRREAVCAAAAGQPAGAQVRETDFEHVAALLDRDLHSMIARSCVFARPALGTRPLVRKDKTRVHDTSTRTSKLSYLRQQLAVITRLTYSISTKSQLT